VTSLHWTESLLHNTLHRSNRTQSRRWTREGSTPSKGLDSPCSGLIYTRRWYP